MDIVAVKIVSKVVMIVIGRRRRREDRAFIALPAVVLNLSM